MFMWISYAPGVHSLLLILCPIGNINSKFKSQEKML